MNHRFLVSASVLALVLAFMAKTPVVGRAQSSAGKTSTPLRTPAGHPDLQGIWTNATVTPLERPTDLAGKEFLTEKEAAEFEKQALQDVNADRRDGAAEADVTRAYNEFWRDRGKVVPSRRTSLIVDTPDGRIPPLSPEGKKRNAERAEVARKMGGPFDGPENRSLAERCIWLATNGPPMLPTNYNSNYQIVQTPEYVVILLEMIHDVRIIPLDARPHLERRVRQWMGDSRGHWDGNTLVVETTNFTDKTNFRGSGENLRVIERFTRTGNDSLLYQFRVEDETTWATPWSGEIPMKKAQGSVFEYACHEGNYGLANSLAGARAQEKAAAEATKKISK